MKNPMYESPCRGCVEKRHPGCHSECEEFIEWDKKYSQYKDIVNKRKKAIKQQNAYVIDNFGMRGRTRRKRDV